MRIEEKNMTKKYTSRKVNEHYNINIKQKDKILILFFQFIQMNFVGQLSLFD